MICKVTPRCNISPFKAYIESIDPSSKSMNMNLFSMPDSIFLSEQPRIAFPCLTIAGIPYFPVPGLKNAFNPSRKRENEGIRI